MSSSEPSTYRVATLPSTDGQVAQVRERARVEGYMAGFAAGAREAAEAAVAQREAFAMQALGAEAKRVELVTQRLAALDQAAAAARARTAPVVAEAEMALYDAAVDLAQIIVGHTLDDAEGSALAAVRRALSDPTFDDVVSVRVSPTDLAVLDGLSVPLPASVTLEPDSSLAPGEAVSQHPVGYLDARLNAAVDRARAALAGAR